MIAKIENEFINNSPHDGDNDPTIDPFTEAFVAGEKSVSLKLASGTPPEIGEKQAHSFLDLTVTGYDPDTSMVTWSVGVVLPPETPR